LGFLIFHLGVNRTAGNSDSLNGLQRGTLGKRRFVCHGLARSKYSVANALAPSASFALFDSAEVRVRLKSELGGKEITMTRLQDWLVEALNREHVTIRAAAKHVGFSLSGWRGPRAGHRHWATRP